MCGGGLGATISSTLGTVIGGTLGFMTGGPAGAMAGASIGQGLFGRNASKKAAAPGAPRAADTTADTAALKAKETQIQKTADTRIGAAQRGAAKAPSASKKGGTLLTSAMGVLDTELNLGKTKLGA